MDSDAYTKEEIEDLMQAAFDELVPIHKSVDNSRHRGERTRNKPGEQPGEHTSAESGTGSGQRKRYPCEKCGCPVEPTEDAPCVACWARGWNDLTKAHKPRKIQAFTN